MSFTDDELERYARHIVLREIGGPGQQKLSRASVLCVGAGGLGAPVLAYLAAAGVGRIEVVDDDRVSLSNLQRQIIHATEDIGALKTTSARRALHAINPHVKVVEHPLRLTDSTAPGLVQRCDLVLDGSDNFATRYLVNRVAVSLGVPLVSGAIAQWEGQVSLFDPSAGGPCYECVFPQAPAEGLAPSCAEAGVMGALAGIIGAIMAAEAIKHLTRAGQTLAGALLIHDALWGESRKVAIAPRDDCPVCGAPAA